MQLQYLLKKSASKWTCAAQTLLLKGSRKYQLSGAPGTCMRRWVLIGWCCHNAPHTGCSSGPSPALAQADTVQASEVRVWFPHGEGAPLHLPPHPPVDRSDPFSVAVAVAGGVGGAGPSPESSRT